MSTGLIEQQINHIQRQANNGNQLDTRQNLPENVQIVGIGTDAVVVKSDLLPQYAWKVFAPQRIEKKNMEYEVYRRLGASPFFATCYSQGENFLCLSYEEGPTL